MNEGHLFHRFAYMKNEIPVAGVAHQAGTCRFGSDPASSVLNTDCRAHEVDNLYVVDTSIFPSIGAVNPALTAMANSLRVGDHLLERMGVRQSPRPPERTAGLGDAPSLSEASRRRRPIRPARRRARRDRPSGKQFELAHGDQRAVVVEVGGGLRSYSAGGRELLDGYGADEMCASGRGQVLLPWPNRIEDGALRVRRDAATSCR